MNHGPIHYDRALGLYMHRDGTVVPPDQVEVIEHNLDELAEYIADAMGSEATAVAATLRELRGTR